MFSSIFRIRLFVVFAVAMIMAVAVYGFAAANTVPASNAGDGNNTISGYTISNVHYTLNTANPSLITGVEFDLSPAVPSGGTVQVKLTAAGATYSACTLNGAGTHATCSGLSDTVLSADQLSVVAAQ